MGHAYIQREDLGLTVLGVPQYGYTVNGVHGQDYDTAVCRAALCRATGCEEALGAYSSLLSLRQTKIEDLGNALADINSAVAKLDKVETTAKVTLSSSTVKTLKKYGFSVTSTKIQYKDAAKLQQDVQYRMDQEDNELQQDMTTMQSFLTKRDDAMQMASKFMKKIAQTRATGIKYIGD